MPMCGNRTQMASQLAIFAWSEHKKENQRKMRTFYGFVTWQENKS
jgi:hypothetical protein